jgi:opacity protein-like surface antigen
LKPKEFAMKKTIMTLLCVTLLASAAMAQTPSVTPKLPFSLYGGGLFTVPQSPNEFSDQFKTGFHGTVGLGFNTLPTMQVVTKIEYHRFNSEAAGVLGLEGGQMSAWTFGADARFAPSLPIMPIKPYGLIGGGFAKVSQGDYTGGTLGLATALNDASFEDQTKFYFNIGAGVELFSTPAFSFFAQGRYVRVATTPEPVTLIPITLGLRFF